MTDGKDKKRKDAERATLGGELMRYGRVAGAVGSTAARVAGRRAFGRGGDSSAQEAAELKAALGGLKGPLMKAAQMLATIPDALPEPLASELRELQSNAPPMGWPFVRRRMAAELGPDWEKRFVRFEREAARAASLGQVHRATAEVAGKEIRVACKLQYPDMASAVAADLKQLRLIFAIWDRWQRAVDTAEIQAEIGERLTEELDYELEARHTALWGDILKAEKGVAVPVVVPALSTGRLLTATWLDGEPIVDFVVRSQADRDRIAHSMFRAWYVPFYGYGVIHGDPHLGNYSVGDDGRRLNLYDFGCVRIFPPSFVGGVIDLYNALRTDDRALAVHAYETWGFEKLSKELVDVLNVWARFLYSPLMEDKVQRIQEADSGLYGAQVAKEVHVALRGQGGVRPPREFVLMDRAAVGLGSVFLRLRAEVNWHRLFHELIADFDVKTLAKRQKAALDRHGLVAQG